MRGPHVRFCERRGGVILRAYSTNPEAASRGRWVLRCARNDDVINCREGCSTDCPDALTHGSKGVPSHASTNLEGSCPEQTTKPRGARDIRSFPMRPQRKQRHCGQASSTLWASGGGEPVIASSSRVDRTGPIALDEGSRITTVVSAKGRLGDKREISRLARAIAHGRLGPDFGFMNFL